MSIRQNRRVVVKTATSYIVNPAVPDLPGTIFTTRGAGAGVTFTLPVPSPALRGWFYDFLSLADQNLTVKTPSAGQAVAFNNLAAISLAASTAGMKIGAGIRAFCDGTSWIITGTTEGVTYTVA